jgi:hypothetical protein
MNSDVNVRVMNSETITRFLLLKKSINGNCLRFFSLAGGHTEFNRPTALTMNQHTLPAPIYKLCQNLWETHPWSIDRFRLLKRKRGWINLIFSCAWS